MDGRRRSCAADQHRQEATNALVRRLGRCSEDGEGARIRRELVVLHVSVATGIALRYRGRGEALEDLVQVAHLGLVKAATSFDPHRGSEFLAYAMPTISGEVKRHFRDQGWDIRPPRRIQELRAEVERAAGELTQRLGRAPRLSEIAAHLGIGRDDVGECVASADLFHVDSLDSPVAGSGAATVGDTLGKMDPLLAMVDDVLSVRPLLEQLPPREHRMLALKFFSGWTQQQIADELGVTQMQVSRLLSQTLRRLREGMYAA